MCYFQLSFIAKNYYQEISILKGNLFEVQLVKTLITSLNFFFLNMKLIDIIKQLIINTLIQV